MKKEKINSPKRGFISKLMTIDKETIKSFYLVEEQRREIRKSNVLKHINLIKNRHHFKTPFVLNKTNGKYKIIDGNHRYEAIKRVLEIDNTFSIKILCAVYNNLDRKSERIAFSDWNSGTKQTANDFLKIYWEDIPLGNEVLKQTGATIYGGKSIKVKLIVGSHIEAKKQGKFSGGYDGGNLKVVEDFSKLEHSDIKLMKAFMLDMKELFGPFDKDNVFWKGTAVAMLYRLWYDNRTIPRKTFLKTLHTIFNKNYNISERWKQQLKTSGRSASVDLYYNVLRPQIERESKVKFVFAK